MPHTISKPPLSRSLSLSLSTHTSGIQMPYVLWMEGEQNKQNVPVIHMTREITVQERLKWSNKAGGHKRGGGELKKKKQKRSHVS